MALGDLHDISIGSSAVEPQVDLLFSLPKGELHLVAVGPWVVHASGGENRGFREPTDMLEGLLNETSLGLQLGRVGQALVGAPTADPDVGTPGDHTVGGGLEDPGSSPLQKGRLDAGDGDLHGVTGDGAVHEEGLAIHMGYALALVG